MGDRNGRLLMTDESTTVGMSPFAPRKQRVQIAAFAELKATLVFSPILRSGR